TQPSTANFICKKLVMLFVDDSPQDRLVGDCATVFIATSDDSDQMGQVVASIVNSPEFFSNYRSKIKTPVEFVVGVVRNLQAQGNHFDLPNAIKKMGISMFENPVPTGWSESGEDWMNSNFLLQRVDWVNDLSRRGVNDEITYIDPLGLLNGLALQSSDVIINFLFDLLLANDVTQEEINIAIEIINDDTAFDINATDAEEKIRRTIGTMLSYPQYQFQ
ncbi:DUF1800 family protein, partial [Pseudomonadota bacterium]